MSDQMSTCESCGIKFEMPEVVTSSKILCAKCAAERRAKQKAAKAAAAAPPPARTPVAQSVGAARPSAVARAPSASRSSTETGRVTQSSSRHAPAEHHEIDPRKVREADAKRMAKIGWLVTGSLTLITGIVLMIVMNTHQTRDDAQTRWEQKLDNFQAEIKKVDESSEDSIKAMKDKITKDTFWKGTRIQEAVTTRLTDLNLRLAGLIKTRSLKEKLNAIEAHFAGAPSVEVLAKDFHDARDQDLKQQASEAGGELEARYKATLKEVTRRYLEALTTAANAAASATTGEGLAPFGPLEDTYRQLLHEAMAPGPTKDAEAQAHYEPLWKQTYLQVNQIVEKLFDEAYQNKVPWTNLLANTADWAIISSSSFKHTFGAGLTLVNAPGEGSASAGLSYTPADKWRDYVLEVEFKIDSGTLVFYTRIGDKMDTKECPGFSVSGAKDPKVPIEFGKTYTMVISVIGNQLTVTGEGISYIDDNIKSTNSRKGEPGIVAQEGTTATITKMRARHLR
jgi:hypothetical protein